MALKSERKGQKLFIEIDLENSPKRSSTGKTYVVASSRGNVESEAEYDGHSVIIGLNAYYFPED